MGDMASRSRQAPEWDAIDLAKFNSVSSVVQEAPRLSSRGSERVLFLSRGWKAPE
jgi:hypothetical protein